ncbi:MAG: ABC transporter ATP-binding protein [Umezawaea sp.]
MISFEAVNKRFDDGTTAVRDLDLDIPEGQVTVLVGSSGCGKTTTLRMINRMLDATTGTVRIDGRDVREIPGSTLRRDIGYVIQQSGLFPHRTVADNIATVPKLLGWDKKRVRDRVAELLDTVGLATELANRYPHQLSGGQQQRVGVARALAADPPILLMDEPFGAVDPVVRTLLQDELLRLQAELRKTIVFVTHDIDEAVRLGDQIAVFRTGGHLVQFSSPAELLAHPVDEFVTDFLGAERGLKLLSLTTLASVPVRSTTTGREGETSDEWLLVLSADDEPLGWRGPGDRTLIPAPGLADGDSLLAGLDATVSSPTGLAIRVDDAGRFRGVSDQQAITESAARFRAQVLVP